MGGVQGIGRIIFNGGIKGIVALIEIEEFGVGESSQVIGEFKAVGRVCGNFLVRRDGVQVGEVLRDIGTLAATVAGHCCRAVLGQCWGDVAIEGRNGVLIQTVERSKLEVCKP